VNVSGKYVWNVKGTFVGGMIGVDAGLSEDKLQEGFYLAAAAAQEWN